MNKINLFIVIIMQLGIVNSCNNTNIQKKREISSQYLAYNDSAIALVSSSSIDRKKALQKAINFLNKAISIDSNGFVAYWNKRNFELELKQYSEAIKTSKQLIRLGPHNPEMYTWTGLLIEKTGDTISSLQYFKLATPLYNKFLDTMSINNKKYRLLAMTKAINLIMLGHIDEGNKLLTDLYNKEVDSLYRKEYSKYLGKSKAEIVNEHQ